MSGLKGRSTMSISKIETVDCLEQQTIGGSTPSIFYHEIEIAMFDPCPFQTIGLFQIRF